MIPQGVVQSQGPIPENIFGNNTLYYGPPVFVHSLTSRSDVLMRLRLWTSSTLATLLVVVHVEHVVDG